MPARGQHCRHNLPVTNDVRGGDPPLVDPTDLVLREYLRVSKNRAGQGQEGRSPDQQHYENAEAVARHPGWRLPSDPYREPTSVSASRYSKSARAEFQRLLADLEDDAFDADALALWESSRGSRRTGEWVTLIELCEERGVRIWVTTHGRRTTRPTPGTGALCSRTQWTPSTSRPRRRHGSGGTCGPTPR